MEKRLSTLEELQGEARALAARLTPRAERATLITLAGELGAGKTSFAQGLAKALGVAEHVTSPTFVLEKIYDLPEGVGRGYARLLHLDAYRLQGPHALQPLGFEESMRDVRNLIVLEWPERVEDALPVPDAAIALKVLADNTRTLSYA